MKIINLTIKGLLLFSVGCEWATAETFQLESPNHRVKVAVELTDSGVKYRVGLDEQKIIDVSQLGLVIDNKNLGDGAFELLDKQTTSHAETWQMLAGRSKNIPDNYQALSLKLKAKDARALQLNLEFRAYDEGVAFRYSLPNQSALKDFTVQNELTHFAFAGNYSCFGFNMGRFTGGHEGEFDPIKASAIREHNLFDNPLVCQTGPSADGKQTTFALAESNVKNYSQGWFTGRGDGGLGVHTVLTPRADNRADGLEQAAVKATMTPEGFTTPWRVIMLGDRPGALTESSLIATLGEPSQVADTRWIKPGKVAWDWWNDNQVFLPEGKGKPGMNTETYKAYIDFASTLGLEYVLIDAGWHKGAAWNSKPGGDLLTPIPEMNMPEILSYAKAHKVGVWVWLQWKQLDWQMDEALTAYEKWGIKGIKVDFMERSDQQMVDYYHKLLSTAAKHHLMVDLHGAYTPNGLVRTYPNFMTQEGVMGAEYNKWSARVTATHNVTIPFTRMILGPIDYTPGGFRHATPADFSKLRRNTLPYVQTTRGQALAMYVVFDSPVMMLADSPLTYAKTPGVWPKPKSEWEDGLEFIQQVPTTWDETRILQGDIGQFIVSARRKGKDWYVGAMTNESGRTLTIPLDFLGREAKGKKDYRVEIWQDGATISSVDKSQAKLNAADSLSLKLAPSGGAVAVLKE